MKNLMAKAMTGRYAEYFSIGDHEERVAKTIYYWVMSTLESVFWGLGRVAYLPINLYASEKKIFFLFHHPSGEDYKFVYYSTHNCSNGKLPRMLQKFVEIFNNYDYPLSDKISTPVFHAYYCGKDNNSQEYNGYEHVRISVDMLPDADDDPANHGRH